MNDAQGMLPLHVALRVETTEEVVVKVLDANVKVIDRVRVSELRVGVQLHLRVRELAVWELMFGATVMAFRIRIRVRVRALRVRFRATGRGGRRGRVRGRGRGRRQG